ncbi:hypothetical protein SAMN05192533_12131 [Mesobacillus persicus]|uniref:HesB-like selenoprotein n=1 Tax=Mesobacillus persicus TaxID=930146 RepID=A0A1H8JGQ2_9BACI|nr:hypothetical protein SAMN05192533_12131 [Mesobacillus persicus]
MQITNDARDFLQTLLNDREAKGIRVYFAGFG